MRKLTIEEKNHYDELGYVVVSDFFSADELCEINEELDGCEAPVQTSGEHERFTYQLAMLTDKTKQSAHDERILNLIEDIVKPGISIFSSKLLTKQPYSASVCHWHRLLDTFPWTFRTRA
ncbi:MULTISPECIES: phytanoyl-CoA dioxygenase family protein [unclassified Paenibacillus]|uniref:phytanoyl-CoA dioxygenase family protein n=1 Tax=unclassified Paenibacillus TaxID=185978 RepID=UPI00362DDEF3